MFHLGCGKIKKLKAKHYHCIVSLHFGSTTESFFTIPFSTCSYTLYKIEREKLIGEVGIRTRLASIATKCTNHYTSTSNRPFSSMWLFKLFYAHWRCFAPNCTATLTVSGKCCSTRRGPFKYTLLSSKSINHCCQKNWTQNLLISRQVL